MSDSIEKMPHPSYGDCNTLGPDGACSECYRLVVESWADGGGDDGSEPLSPLAEKVAAKLAAQVPASEGDTVCISHPDLAQVEALANRMDTSDGWRFEHEDGRIFVEESNAKGRDPVVGDWLGFDEDIVFVTRQTGPRSYDVIEHPKRAEIMATMLEGPMETGWARANQINRTYAASRTPPVVLPVICTRCGGVNGPIEMDAHLDPSRCIRELHRHVEKARRMREQRDEARKLVRRLCSTLAHHARPGAQAAITRWDAETAEKDSAT